MEGRQGTEKGAANKSSNVVKNLFGVLFVCLPDTQGIKIPNIFFSAFLNFYATQTFFFHLKNFSAIFHSLCNAQL